MAIKDSGERTVFPNGSQRDMHEGKGDMVSVPWEAILRLSRHYEDGAKKYIDVQKSADGAHTNFIIATAAGVTSLMFVWNTI